MILHWIFPKLELENLPQTYQYHAFIIGVVNMGDLELNEKDKLYHPYDIPDPM
jgi:hypothetical protein